MKKFEEENSFKNAVKMYDEDDLAFVNEVRQSKQLQEIAKANELKQLVDMAKVTHDRCHWSVLTMPYCRPKKPRC